MLAEGLWNWATANDIRLLVVGTALVLASLTVATWWKRGLAG